MKNIMILGICRTGKTTFSRMIQKEFSNYQIIEVDTIISALQKTIKDIPIGFIHDNLSENKLPQFLNLLIEKNINKNGKHLGFIINADSIMPKDLVKYFNLENTIVYYFVNSKLTSEKILENCRKYDDMADWTTRRSDEEILKHMDFYKPIEQKIIKDCNKYGFKCIDTSINREKVLNDLLQSLKIDLGINNEFHIC
ncbi:MAG: hypothetical protein HFJ60_01110 [Clostridia bacterium]|jgi:adenylate kinase family enzyme|nr:hypothetical protein [Clostridia bacterium]